MESRQKHCNGSSPRFSPVILSEPKTLSEFIKAFSDSLPRTALVTSGYVDDSYSLEISCNEILRIHSLHTIPVVLATNADNERLPPIPLTIEKRFSLLYDPHDNTAEAMKGLVFDDVSSLLSTAQLPKAVCVAEDWSGDCVAIRRGEILAINKKFLSRSNASSGLVTFSISKMVEKFLPKECTGKFSTDPMLIQMSLQNIFACITNPFPSKVYTPKPLLHTESTVLTLVGSDVIQKVNFSTYDISRREFTPSTVQLTVNQTAIEVALIEDPPIIQSFVAQPEMLHACSNDDSIEALSKTSGDSLPPLPPKNTIQLPPKSVKKSRSQPSTVAPPPSVQTQKPPPPPPRKQTPMVAKRVKSLPNTPTDTDDYEEVLCTHQTDKKPTSHEAQEDSPRYEDVLCHTGQKTTSKYSILYDYAMHQTGKKPTSQYVREDLYEDVLCTHQTGQNPTLHDAQEDHSGYEDVLSTPTLHDAQEEYVYSTCARGRSTPTKQSNPSVETEKTSVKVKEPKMIQKSKAVSLDGCPRRWPSFCTIRRKGEIPLPGRLPVSIHVCADASLVPGSEYLDVIAIENKQVVLAEDSARKQVDIPLVSAEKFSLLYYPAEAEGIHDPLLGSTFNSVSELLKLSNAPKVIRVTKSWSDEVVENDILIIQSVLLRENQKKGFLSFSVSSQSEKFVSKACKANFSTAATLLGLSMLDLIQHVPDMFPCKVCKVKYRGQTPKCHLIDIMTLKEVLFAPVLECVPINVRQRKNSIAAESTIINIPISSCGAEVVVLNKVKELEEESASVTARSSCTKDEHKERCEDELAGLSEDQKMKNIQTISRMSMNQVLHILENLGLSKYRDKFQKESISGDILCQLTEEVFQKELCMPKEDCTLLLHLTSGGINVSSDQLKLH